MKKLISIFILISFFSISVKGQNLNSVKLIVGVVIDQMRFNDLYRYYPYYGENGFKKLIKEGTNFTFAHYNYEVTNTGPGHASIYTGTTPYYHGIINNDFYHRSLGKNIYCVDDSEVSSVGSNTENGKKSPRNLLSTTITDELKLFTNKKSKVVSIAIKDRSAILPGGHMADGVFWYDNKIGAFISSTYYMKQLPNWLEDFNKKRFVEKYMSQSWELLLPKEAYSVNPKDDSPYENDIFKEGKTSFLHIFENLTITEKYDKFQYTPFANQIIIELAKEVVINEGLGNDSITDFLAISFSSPDYIGHTFGNFSYEVMDTYVRLDRQLEDLIAFLDSEIGKNNYLLFLTSDHAAIETPGILRENKIPTGGIGSSRILDSLKAFSIREYGSIEIIENFSGKQLYLNRSYIQEKKLDNEVVEKSFARYLRVTFPEIQTILTRSFLETQTATRNPISFLINGWHPSLSGDVVFNLRPGYLNNLLERGTTHGSSYNYDTHIPLIFYGWNIPNQEINDPVWIVDIASTIANILKINEPNACIGKPILKIN